MRKTARQLDSEISQALRRHATKKSPLRVACRTLAFGIKSCEWKVVGDFRGAEFLSRTRADESAIVHPSTKTAGKWQVSFFDEQGPSRDSQHSDVADALRQVSPKKWKLKAVA
ncbi:MAG TPA: hypothetical protein VLE97_11155 [Gaiellaceae bacterium]|nr:hypothetical protein [Gaiellaceae bacterium]